MATDSFKFWDSYMRALDRVDDATAGRLVKALCHEVFEGEAQCFDGEPMLGMVYDVMLSQAIQSRDIARQARSAAKRPRPNARKNRTSGELAHASGPSSEKKREEEKGTESSSLTRNPTVAPGGVLAPPPAPDDAPPPLP